MVLPLVIAGIAAASTIAAASAANSRAGAVNANISQSMENQEQQYELLRKQRSAEKREATFQFMREKELYRMNTLQQVRQQQLNNSIATVEFYNQAMQLQQAQFATNQQAEQAEQGLQQERGAAYQAGQGVVGESMQAAGQADAARRQGDLVAGITGQTGTARDSARQEAVRLTNQSQRGARTNALEQLAAQTEQNTTINRGLVNLQTQLSTSALTAQTELNNMALQNQADQSNLNVQLLQQQQKMFNVSHRANRIATRQKFKNQGEADALIHQANIQQLESQMLPTNNLNFGTVLGAAGQLAGAFAGYGGLGGLFGGGGGGSSSGGTSYGLSSNSVARSLLSNSSGGGLFSSGGSSAASNGLINYAPSGYSGASTGRPVVPFGSPMTYQPMSGNVFNNFT